MNLFKTKSFWISFAILLIIAFFYGMYNAPVTVTTCITPEHGGNCTNEWGTALDYRTEVGLIAILLTFIPSVLVSLLISYFFNKNTIKTAKKR